MIKAFNFIVSILLLFTLTTSAVEYKTYQTKKIQTEYFQVEFSRDNDEFQFKPAPFMVTTGDKIVNKLILEEHSIRINDKLYPIESISDCKVSEDDGKITILFYTPIDSSKLAHFKKGNRYSTDKKIAVPQSDFVRGIIFSVSGDITIEGEVNKDVISLFGNINVVGNGVVRGDIATITGKIEIENSANTYGEIFDHNKKGRGSKHRKARDINEFDFEPYFSYNRVDGLGISGKVFHHDVDSILPTMEAEIGIGFASDRGRYKFLIEQVLFREKAIALGGTFYRQLLSDDDWLIGSTENSVFALLAKEDYKDYFEAEGGSLYLKAIPSKNFTFQGGYSFYESNWLPSNRHLWALLRGKDRLFDTNYDSWNNSIRSTAITETDTSDIGSLFASLHYYSDSTQSVSKQSNWHISGEFEFSLKSLNSDFDYHRYIITLRRHQKINGQSIFTIRTVLGNSDGYLPIFKRFHLGGLGTLHGYALKELMGTRFWMINSEYKIDFPKSEFGISLFWDMGQIADDRQLNSDIEIKQSLGLSIFFEKDFTVSVAKRLDHSTNDSPKLYLRFSQIF